MLNRKVEVIHLHTPFHVPGVGNLDKTFDSRTSSAGTKTLKNLKMTTAEAGVQATFEYAGKKVELVVPYVNIQVLTLAPENAY